VNDLFQIDGIPKTFIYDREGKIVAQSIDMRTQKQFLETGESGITVGQEASVGCSITPSRR
jgi:hypothetical protein